MAPRIIKLPDVGEGVAEAEIVEWHVEIGQEVAEDQVIAAVMTDKATVEIPSPVAGKIIERGPEIGTRIAVGSKLVAIEPAGSGDGKAPSAPESRNEPKEPAASPPKPAPQPGAVERPPPHTRPKTVSTGAAKPLASPSVRRRALELGVDLRLVPSSQHDRRIRHEDLDAYIPSGDATRIVRRHADRADQQIKVTGLRRRIAERMALSTRRIAHFSYIEEVDMTAVEMLRKHLNDRHGAERGKLTVLPFILRALSVALNEFPQMNATYDDENEVITRHGAVHAGIATQTGSGLMVPVLRNAGDLGLWECAAEIRRLSAAARDGTATRDELSGSTVTLTSLGELGGIATTPVVNWRGSRDHRRKSHCGAASLARQPVCTAQDDEPVVILRPSCGGRARCGTLHRADQGSAGDARNALHRGLTWKRSRRSCSSLAAGPGAMSQRSVPDSSAFRQFWSRRAASGGPASMSAAFRRKR